MKLNYIRLLGLELYIKKPIKYFYLTGFFQLTEHC